MLDINLTGTFLSCRAFARPLVAAGHPVQIVNFGSMSGYVARPPAGSKRHNASKAGVTMLTKSLAVEWVGHGIRVNSIAPAMASAMTRQFTDVNDTLHGGATDPDGTWGSRNRPARLPLLSDDASYITGQDYLVDGGYLVPGLWSRDFTAGLSLQLESNRCIIKYGSAPDRAIRSKA